MKHYHFLTLLHFSCTKGHDFIVRFWYSTLIFTPTNILKSIMSDYFTNYNYVGNTKVSVSIKKTYANKCTLSEIFLTEILKSFSVF